MNGYDFDLLFKGTKSDYLKLTETFESQGIGYDLVRTTHTGAYESVNAKRQEIATLLVWLDENRNARFDYDDFVDSNPDLLDPSNPYIIVQEEPLQLDLPFARIEAVKTIEELKGMVLTEVPILLTVNRRNRKLIRNELRNVLKRPDVKRQQLFFYIHPSMDSEQVIRVISDLGVKDPQIIDSPDDECVVEYLNDYPATSYVRKAIATFRRTVDELSNVLDKAYTVSEATSANNKREIEKLDAQLDTLRDIKSRMRVKETIILTRQHTDETCYGLCKSLEARILTWRNRHRSISGTERITEAAWDYANELQRLLRQFEPDVFRLCDSERTQVEQSFRSLYYEAQSVPSFRPAVDLPQYPVGIDLPVIEHVLCRMTETSYVAARNNPFGLFGAQAENHGDFNAVETANYETWRLEAQKIVMPLVFAYVKSYKERLDDYYETVARAYREQLDFVIAQTNAEKELATSKLSSRERKLQEDVDWLDEFNTQLLRIERD